MKNLDFCNKKGLDKQFLLIFIKLYIELVNKSSISRSKNELSLGQFQ